MVCVIFLAFDHVGKSMEFIFRWEASVWQILLPSSKWGEYESDGQQMGHTT
jgi:hypothetical protein